MLRQLVPDISDSDRGALPLVLAPDGTTYKRCRGIMMLYCATGAIKHVIPRQGRRTAGGCPNLNLGRRVVIPIQFELCAVPKSESEKLKRCRFNSGQ